MSGLPMFFYPPLGRGRGRRGDPSRLGPLSFAVTRRFRLLSTPDSTQTLRRTGTLPLSVPSPPLPASGEFRLSPPHPRSQPLSITLLPDQHFGTFHPRTDSPLKDRPNNRIQVPPPPSPRTNRPFVSTLLARGSRSLSNGDPGMREREKRVTGRLTLRGSRVDLRCERKEDHTGRVPSGWRRCFGGSVMGSTWETNP